jgi:heme/copper-type cytochrome/quinol oxidase subunit 2
MPTPIAEFLFWTAAAVIVVAQALILRSTRRGMKIGPPGSGSALEWAFAIVPAICLAGLLVWTWYAMHSGTFTFDAKTPAAGVSA